MERLPGDSEDGSKIGLPEWTVRFSQCGTGNGAGFGFWTTAMVLVNSSEIAVLSKKDFFWTYAPSRAASSAFAYTTYDDGEDGGWRKDYYLTGKKYLSGIADSQVCRRLKGRNAELKKRQTQIVEVESDGDSTTKKGTPPS